MLKMYLMSSLIYMIILRIMICIANNTKEMRKINFEDYTSKEIKKGNWIYLMCFVPVLRIILIGIAIFLAFARKEDLDKLFEKEN